MPRGSTYANTSQNRNLGRVGMAMGSMPVSGGSGASSARSSYSSGSSATPVKTYVDNSANRRLGRVGMEHGTMVVSKSSTSNSGQSTGTKTYVDNEMNRRLDRVGLQHGSMVVSKSSTSGSRQSTSPKIYVDNGLNGSPKSSSSASNSISQGPKVYKDNAFNRRVGRVGKPLGSHVISKKSTASVGFKDGDNNKYGIFRDQEPAYTRKRSDHTNITNVMLRCFISNQHGDFENDREDDELTVDAAERMMETVRRGEVFSEPKRAKENKMPFEDYEGREIIFSDLKFDEKDDKIGHGGFGDVYAASWNGLTVAVKKLRVQRVSKRRLKQFDEEITMFCKLKHRNIIRFLGACLITPNICMVMEFMQGSLYDELHVKEYQFTLTNKNDIVKGTIAGLAYLHGEGLAHCDVKSSNILITIDGDNIITKITDFGLSIMKGDTEMSSSSKNVVKDIGTPRYSAPEVLNGELLNVNQMMKADIYSFGLVVFEVFSEEEPYAQLNYNQLKVQVGQRGHRPDIDGVLDIDDALVNLVEKCWSEKGDNRPSADVCKRVCEATL